MPPWGASVPHRKRSNPRLRWRKKYEALLSIENAAQELGEYLIHYIDRALGLLASGEHKRAKRLAKRALRRGHASLVGVRRDKKGLAQLVDHLVVNGRGRIRHYGIHGARGWSPENPDQVQFKNKRGEDLEWEEIGEVEKEGRLWPERTRRWKRAGRKSNPNKKRRSYS